LNAPRRKNGRKAAVDGLNRDRHGSGAGGGNGYRLLSLTLPKQQPVTGKRSRQRDDSRSTPHTPPERAHFPLAFASITGIAVNWHGRLRRILAGADVKIPHAKSAL